jgi:hypothetical protein
MEWRDALPSSCFHDIRTGSICSGCVEIAITELQKTIASLRKQDDDTRNRLALVNDKLERIRLALTK